MQVDLPKNRFTGKTPDFWWNRELSVPAILLLPIAHFYGRTAKKRMLSDSRTSSKLPVICVGNYVVGGTGKTPFAIALYNLLKDKNYNPTFMLRGYGGKLKGPVMVDPKNHNAREVGDEALLLADVGPTVVATNRQQGATFVENTSSDIIIMDDGFQNSSLKKDVSIVLIDAEVGMGNGHCMPAGPLRAPIDTQIRKTDILVVVGNGEGSDPVIRRAARKGLMPNFATLEPKATEGQIGKPVLAYAGIGRPQKFFNSAKEVGFKVMHECLFPDHHFFSEGEMRQLLNLAEEQSLILLTTSKDKARLRNMPSKVAESLFSQSMELEVDMVVNRIESLWGRISDLLEKKGHLVIKQPNEVEINS